MSKEKLCQSCRIRPFKKRLKTRDKLTLYLCDKCFEEYEARKEISSIAGGMRKLFVIALITFIIGGIVGYGFSYLYQPQTVEMRENLDDLLANLHKNVRVVKVDQGEVKELQIRLWRNEELRCTVKVLDESLTPLGEPIRVKIRNPYGEEVFSVNTQEAEIRYRHLDERSEGCLACTYKIVLENSSDRTTNVVVVLNVIPKS